MSDDYLWDKSGRPDPDVERLERALAKLGHAGGPLVPPETLEGVTPDVAPDAAPARIARPDGGPVRGARPWVRALSPHGMPAPGVPSGVWAAAAAALVVLGAVASLMVTRLTPAWPVARVDGAPRVGERTLRASGRLAVGDWLETDAASRARLTVGTLGEVLVEPGTRLRLLEAGERRQRLHLALGTVTAVIVAPPRQFVVETPSAHAVDLGCAYTLEVDPTGAALVTVVAGWVSFEHEGRESFIPAGARCATRRGVGPGTPYFTDASNGLKNALTLLDVAPADDGARGERLTAVLAEARVEDAFTLWHLLARLTGGERDAVYERLAVLVPPPAGVTREGVLAGDRAMLDRWWDELGFGEMKWWRLWQRSWPGAGGPVAGPSGSDGLPGPPDRPGRDRASRIAAGGAPALAGAPRSAREAANTSPPRRVNLPDTRDGPARGRDRVERTAARTLPDGSGPAHGEEEGHEEHAYRTRRDDADRTARGDRPGGRRGHGQHPEGAEGRGGGKDLRGRLHAHAELADGEEPSVPAGGEGGVRRPGGGADHGLAQGLQPLQGDGVAAGRRGVGHHGGQPDVPHEDEAADPQGGGREARPDLTWTGATRRGPGGNTARAFAYPLSGVDSARSGEDDFPHSRIGRLPGESRRCDDPSRCTSSCPTGRPS
jgi:hypothetical protein